MKTLRVPRARRAARAFTLVEMGATIALFGIIGAIAAGVYVTSVGSHQVAAAEVLLGDVVAAQKELAANFGSYTTWASDLGAVASNASLLSDGMSSAQDEVSMAVGTEGTLGLAVLVDADRCVLWRVASLSSGGRQLETDLKDGTCAGAHALPVGEEPSKQMSAVRPH